MQINSITDHIPSDIIPSSIFYVLGKARINTFADLIRYNTKDIVYLPHVGNYKALQFQDFKNWILENTNYLELEKIEIERLSKIRLNNISLNYDFINLLSFDVPQSLLSEEIKSNVFKNKYICTWDEIFATNDNVLSSSEKLNFLELHLNNCIGLLTNFSEDNILEISLSILKEKNINELSIAFLDKDYQLKKYFDDLNIYNLEDFVLFLNREEKDVNINFLSTKKRLSSLIKLGVSNYLFNSDRQILPYLDNFMEFIIENEKDSDIDFNLIKSKNYKTLEEIGQEQGVTRERIRQKISNYFSKIYARYKFAIDKINGVIYSHVQRNGGILSVQEAWGGKSKSSFDTISFFCSNYFNSRCKVVNDFLIIDKSNIINETTVKFKEIFKGIESLNIETVILDKDTFDWKSTELTLKIFFQNIMKLNIDENGNFDTSNFSSNLDIVESIVKNSDQPIHYSEVANIVRNTNWSKSYDKASNLDRAVHATLDRSELVLLFGPGTFIHKSNLGLSDELIENVITICKNELKNFEYPTSTVFLCEILKDKYNIEFEQINSYILNSLLNKQSEIVNYRKNRVGFRGVVKYDSSISEILEDILLKLEEPITIQEVTELFPKNFYVPITSIPNAITSNPNILIIRENILKLIHIKYISEFAYIKDKVKDLALIYLNSFSEKVYIKELISYIKQNLSINELNNCDTAIRFFLQESPELFISSSGIVFLKEFLQNREKIDLIDLICLIIDSEIVIKPSEIKDIIKNDYKFYDLVDPTFYAAIERGRSKNLFIKKPYSIYYSPNINEATLYQKIKTKYSSTIENALNKLTEQQTEPDFEIVAFLSEYLFYNEKYTKCLFFIDNFILNYSNQEISKFKEIKDTCLLSI